jgi:uncharacterized membrane protein
LESNIANGFNLLDDGIVKFENEQGNSFLLKIVVEYRLNESILIFIAREILSSH